MPLDPSCDLSPSPASCDLSSEYQTLMGKLLFLSVCTRPDISYAVNCLCQFNATPRPNHLAAAKHVLHYLKGTLHLSIHYHAISDSLSLLVYSDSDWAGLADRILVSGHCWFYSECLIDWKSQHQRTVALLSTEAEYMALTSCVQSGL
jgi:hypothetical protein